MIRLFLFNFHQFSFTSVYSVCYRESNIAEIQTKLKEIFQTSPNNATVVKMKRSKVKRSSSDMPVRTSERLQMKQNLTVSTTSRERKKKKLWRLPVNVLGVTSVHWRIHSRISWSKPINSCHTNCIVVYNCDTSETWEVIPQKGQY